VQFSVGVSGRYLLHVSLRPTLDTPLAPLPGSPFALEVVPGVAHPLSTRIPAELLPLRGALEKVEPGSDSAAAQTGKAPRSRCCCTLVLGSRDKMGNLCQVGGADISCGCMAGSHLEWSFEDCRDGQYIFKWWSAVPGSFTVFVKIDGLHVLGSPAMLYLTSGTPDVSRSEVIANRCAK